jgi:predicted component of type VI protein secretion system
MRIGKKPAHPPVAVAQQVHQLKQLLPLGSGLRSQRQQSLEELNSQELWLKQLLPLGSGLRSQRQQSLEEAIFRRAPCAQQELF